MPIIASSTDHLARKNNNPIPDDPSLSPERRLIAAILRQAIADTRSPRPLIRAEAQRFWGSPSVAFWDELLDLGGKLRRYSQALLLAGVLLLPACVPPPNSDVSRSIDRFFGVPSAEEQLYCHTVQQTYLAKSVPELPPSCEAILKMQRARQAVQP